MRSTMLAVALPVVLSAQFQTRLSPKTSQAFDSYRDAVESQMDWTARFTAARKLGEITIAPTGKDGTFTVKDGLIHDWAAATTVNGSTVEKALAVLQDYASYKSIYAPEVADSRVLRHDANHWDVYLKLVKKKAITVVLNSEYSVDYRSPGDGRWSLTSRSTKMSELDGSKELAPDTGHGFLWRLNAYWLIEPRPSGVYLECRTISLSRDIPTGLGWIIRPMVSSLPRESLQATLEATARALHP